MGITIKDLTAENLSDLGKSNSEFIIDSKIIPHYGGGHLSYNVTAIPEYKKCYLPEDPVLYKNYIKDADKHGWFVYVDGKLAG